MISMKTKNIMAVLSLSAIVLPLFGCKPGAPPDIAEGPRKSLVKAKAVEAQLQQTSQEQKKTVDDQAN